METIVARLIKFAQMYLDLQKEDTRYVWDKLCRILKINDYNYETLDYYDNNIRAILDDLFKQLNSNGKKYLYNDFLLLSDEIMDVLTPLPSVINNKFHNEVNYAPTLAMEYLYNLNMNNNYINNISSYQDEWIDYKDDYKFKYIVEDSNNNSLNRPNKREIYFNFNNHDCTFLFNYSENLNREFEFKTTSEDIKDILSDEYEFLKTFNNLFICNVNNEFKGASKEINFFERKGSNMIINNFYPNTSIEILDTKFNTLLLRSDNKDEIIDTALYITNTWKILNPNNYVYYITSIDDNYYAMRIVLLNKHLEEIDNIFVDNIIDTNFVYTGNVILNAQTKKDISKLANLLSDDTFDIDWYLNSNLELNKYKNMILQLIDRKNVKVDKNEAISTIQNEISINIDNALKELIAYNKDEELISFINLLK